MCKYDDRLWLKCSDQRLTHRKKPYLQYFHEIKEYGLCPFGASTLAAFQRQFREKDLAELQTFRRSVAVFVQTAGEFANQSRGVIP